VKPLCVPEAQESQHHGHFYSSQRDCKGKIKGDEG